MEVMRRGLRAQGLSSSAAALALAAKRSSTDALYTSRWKHWAAFAYKGRFDPVRPSAVQMANFLDSIHTLQKLKAGTLAGYRSAIVYTISVATGKYRNDLTDAPVLRNLLDGIRNREVKNPKSFPAWDIFLVLEVLRGKDFEPLESISLKMLTLKTVFLVSLASSRRVSGVHALSGLDSDIAFSRHKKDRSVTLCMLPEFRAKNQKPDAPSPTVVIPALANLVSDPSELSLCPLRALRIYLKRTAPHRATKRRLFVSLNTRYSSDISVGTIARWLVELVKFAYHKTRTPVEQTIKAHEIRAISTSLALVRGVSVDRIMAAAYWRSENTFTSFYLRHYSTLRADGTCGIDRLVVAQTATSAN